MLTFFHSPNSRSSAIAALIEEMNIADWVETRIVTIPRQDGSGRRDPSNPHPEGKVPALVHDGHVITERGAIILHLCTLFPDSGLSPAPGTAAWGEFISWMVWYQGVLEPVVIFEGAALDHPWLTSTFRSHKEAVARIRAALDRGPWLMGDTYSAADLLVHAPYAWFKEAAPDDPTIRDWIARCMARPTGRKILDRDAALIAAQAEATA
ncbi:MAG: glutathione S-transferase family protein [Tabrizicola sp.]|nr:glutathione S-transferase family protein [Tabrizicola sp.]